MRLLQLSDPHLLADPLGQCHGRPSLEWLRHGLRQALAEVGPPDLLLITGDLCEDLSWGGYALLRDLLAPLPFPVALLSGNHDHPFLLRAVLGRRAVLAPASLPLAGGRLLCLESHRPGWVGGWLGPRQRRWLARKLAESPEVPLLVAVHHPPLPIGDPGMDAIGLADGAELLELLAPVPQLRAVLFGHVHQHWQAELPGRPADLDPVLLLGCPSSLCGFGPVQPCPLGRSDDPGGRLITLSSTGLMTQTLLRWPGP
jgi:Icc protein